jgi:signal transduction histidine kinase
LLGTLIVLFEIPNVMKLLSRAVKIKYLLLVAITVFVIFGNLAFMQRVQHLKMDNAKIINLLGKEQLILNKIGNQWVSWNSDSSKQDQIHIEFAKLMKINNGLIDGDEEQGLHDMENLKLKNKMLKLRDSLIVLNSMVSKTASNSQSFLDLHILIQTCLERIADDFYHDTQSKYLFINKLQIALALLTVIAFLIVIFLNYMPLEKKLQDSIYELERQDDNLRSLINSTRESIYFLNKNGKVLYFNKLGKETLLKRLGKELQVGDDFEQFLFMGMEDRFHDCFQKALNLQISEMEWQVVLEGKLVWYYFGFFPVLNEKFEVLGVSFIASNIQEKKQAALKNQAYVVELEKIAWRQSHLLRAPVANIIGLSKLLLRNPERQMSDETKHLLSMISAETEKMDQEIHKIVQYSSKLSSKNDIF